MLLFNIISLQNLNNKKHYQRSKHHLPLKSVWQIKSQSCGSIWVISPTVRISSTKKSLNTIIFDWMRRFVVIKMVEFVPKRRKHNFCVAAAKVIKKSNLSVVAPEPVPQQPNSSSFGAVARTESQYLQLPPSAPSEWARANADFRTHTHARTRRKIRRRQTRVKLESTAAAAVEAAIRFYTTAPKEREKRVSRARKILRSDANSHLACSETFSISGPISAAMRWLLSRRAKFERGSGAEKQREKLVWRQWQI